MKFIKKALLSLFVAVIVVAPASGYPIEAVKWVNKKTGETIYNIKEIHLGSKKNQESFIVKIAKKLGALVLVEDLFSCYKGKDIQIKEAIKKPTSGTKFLHGVYQQCKMMEVPVVNVETRHGLVFMTFSGRSPEEALGRSCMAVRKIFLQMMEDLKKDEDGPVLDFCHENLEKILRSKYCRMAIGTASRSISNFEKIGLLAFVFAHGKEIAQLKMARNIQSAFMLRSELIPETYGFTDIKIIRELSKGRKKGYKNFIICSGAKHGDAVEAPLAKMGFTIDGERLHHKDHQKEIDVKTIFKKTLQ